MVLQKNRNIRYFTFSTSEKEYLSFFNITLVKPHFPASILSKKLTLFFYARKSDDLQTFQIRIGSDQLNPKHFEGTYFCKKLKSWVLDIWHPSSCKKGYFLFLGQKNIHQNNIDQKTIDQKNIDHKRSTQLNLRSPSQVRGLYFLLFGYYQKLTLIGKIRSEILASLNGIF